MVMDKGALVEEGTHDELVALGGHYAHLLRQREIAEDGGGSGKEVRVQANGD